MTVYIDESGNTGGASIKNSKFNFFEQPYYSLAGIIIEKSKESEFESFINSLKTKYRVFATELKAKSLYESKPGFINDLIDYIIDNNVPFVIELMDKKYYLNTQLVNYFIVPFHLYPIDDEVMEFRVMVASDLDSILDDSIYEKFLNAVQAYSNEELEAFYDVLIDFFTRNNMESLLEAANEIKAHYFEAKLSNPAEALKSHLPLPDENSNSKLIHLLPNYNAFSNMIGRLQKYKTDNMIQSLDIVHDEQKQFDKIFKEILDTMKRIDTDSLIENSFVSERAIFNIENELDVLFSDSKSNQFIQVSDLLSGFVMRLWNDFSAKKVNDINKYKSSAKKFIFTPHEPLGINFVVPRRIGGEFMRLIYG